MRIWLVDPMTMCRQHLLGEHAEIHMFIGSMRKGTSLDGYMQKGEVDLRLLDIRHAHIVREMEARKMDHKSDFPSKDEYLELMAKYVDSPLFPGHVDMIHNYHDLAVRCPRCRKLQEHHAIYLYGSLFTMDRLRLIYQGGRNLLEEYNVKYVSNQLPA